MRAAISLLLVCSSSIAGEPEQYAIGRGDLPELVGHGLLFTLTKPYIGRAILAYHRGTSDEKPQKARNLRFTHFTPDASRYSDPGRERPHRPAIIVTSSLKGDGFATGEFAFYEIEAPPIEAISEAKTLNDLHRLFPNLVCDAGEGDLVPTYWYNYFQVTGQHERYGILLCSATCDEHGNIQQLNIWTGNLSPKK